jgi:heme A synthase
MHGFFLEAHRVLANMMNLFPLLVGIWGIALFAMRRTPDGNFNGALAIGFGLFALEAVVGLALILFGSSPNRVVHLLYGVTSVLVIPAIYAFTRGRNSTRESLLYGLGMLFIWGLAERAFTTAGR